MARRKTARRPRTQKVSDSTTLVMVPQGGAPARRRSGGTTRRRSSGRRRRSGGGRRSYGGGSSLQKTMVAHAVGGFAVGFIEKSFPQLPSLPLVGRKGAIALAAMFLANKHPIISDIGKAAAAISGYELGSTGSISGEDNIAAQI